MHKHSFLPPFFKRSAILAICAVGLSISSAQAATPSFWRETGYLYQANKTPIRKVLEDFSNQFGVMLEMSPLVKGTIDGRISSNSAVEFLDRLALTRKFRWFVYSNTLYISPMQDNLIETLSAENDNVQDLRQVLVGIGLFEPRFGWAEMNDAQSVIITGPTEYVRLVKKILGRKEVQKSDLEVMIFRLRYANAEDREIQYRNKTIVTQGVATILRSLLQDKKSPGGGNNDLSSGVRNPFASASNGGSGRNPGLSSNMGGMGNSMNSGMGGSSPLPKAPTNPFSFLNQNSNDPNQDNSLDRRVSVEGNDELPSYVLPPLPNKKEKRSSPIVESDARLNAVIIRDDPSKRDYYQRLIDQFDVAPKMVEIEAMILDINRTKMKDIGIDWGFRAGNTQVGGSALANAALSLNPATKGATLLIRNLDKFYASVRALEQNGDAYILAKPTVLTMDNLGAVLDLSQTAYISLVGERVADVLPVTAGTMLKVTPRVINEANQQKVHLVVDIEDGTVQQKEGSSTPSVQKSTISTQAIIDENQALVIGGYQSQSNNRYQQKIPVLGDIPFLGRLFTTTQNNDANKERLFVIVPRAIARRYNSQTMQADYVNPNTDTGMPSTSNNSINDSNAVRLGENIGGGQILPKRNPLDASNIGNFNSPARPPITLPANPSYKNPTPQEPISTPAPAAQMRQSQPTPTTPIIQNNQPHSNQARKTSAPITGYGTVIEGAPSQVIRNKQLMGTQQGNITNPNQVANPANKPLEKKNLNETLNRFERNER
jgi:type III secretion protein C